MFVLCLISFGVMVVDGDVRFVGGVCVVCVLFVELIRVVYCKLVCFVGGRPVGVSGRCVC